MNRRALLATLPSIVLAGCATRLGLAERVEITRKYVRLYPGDGEEPINAAVRRYDPAVGPYYRNEIHDSLEDDIETGDPIVISETLAERLRVEYDIVEFGIRGCETDADGNCRHTTLGRGDFNEVEAGDVVDLIYRSSGAGLVSVHERHERRR